MQIQEWRTKNYQYFGAHRPIVGTDTAVVDKVRYTTRGERLEISSGSRVEMKATKVTSAGVVHVGAVWRTKTPSRATCELIVFTADNAIHRLLCSSAIRMDSATPHVDLTVGQLKSVEELEVNFIAGYHSKSASKIETRNQGAAPLATSKSSTSGTKEKRSKDNKSNKRKGDASNSKHKGTVKHEDEASDNNGDEDAGTSRSTVCSFPDQSD